MSILRYLMNLTYLSIRLYKYTQVLIEMAEFNFKLNKHLIKSWETHSPNVQICFDSGDNYTFHFDNHQVKREFREWLEKLLEGGSYSIIEE